MREGRSILNRLVDDACLFAQVRFKFIKRHGLQCDDARGEFQRCLCRSVCAQITVEVCASEGYNYWQIRTGSVEAPDAFVATAGVKGNQQIIGAAFILMTNSDVMAEFPENASPPERRHSIAKSGPGRCRRGDSDSHQILERELLACHLSQENTQPPGRQPGLEESVCYKAQVRKPAHTSRRSGV